MSLKTQTHGNDDDDLDDRTWEPFPYDLRDLHGRHRQVSRWWLELHLLAPSAHGAEDSKVTHGYDGMIGPAVN